MKLDVLPSSATWYSGGLNFTCTQCGNCCTGGPGFVWISPEEVERLAAHLKLSAEQVIRRYCRKVDGRLSLKETRTPEGNYDCIFLREQPAEGSDQPRRVCSVYEVRPLQCRTWPFWEGNLASQQAWERAGRRCHGINQGRRFTLEQIHAIRDAAEWPKDPPSSE